MLYNFIVIFVLINVEMLQIFILGSDFSKGFMYKVAIENLFSMSFKDSVKPPIR